MAFGIVPTIEHIYPFYTKTVVTLPKDIFQELVRKGKISPSSRGVPGRLIGYQHPLTRVPAVFTDRGFAIHNRSVTYQEDDVREPLIQLGPEGSSRDKTPSFFEAIITGSSQNKAPKSKGAPIENFPEEPLMFDDEETEWMDEGEKDGDAAVLKRHFTEISQDSHSESSIDGTEEEQAEEGVKTAHLSGQTKTPAKARIPKSQQPSPPVETGMVANENGRRYWSTETSGQPMSKHHGP